MNRRADLHPGNSKVMTKSNKIGYECYAPHVKTIHLRFYIELTNAF